MSVIGFIHYFQRNIIVSVVPYYAIEIQILIPNKIDKGFSVIRDDFSNRVVERNMYKVRLKDNVTTFEMNKTLPFRVHTF